MGHYLFLSYEGCIKQLAQGKIRESHLSDALFAFDCSEDYAYCPPVQALSDWTGIEDEAKLRRLNWSLIKQLKTAEREGRCEYCSDSRGRREFHVRHGLGNYPMLWYKPSLWRDVTVTIIDWRCSGRFLAVRPNSVS